MWTGSSLSPSLVHLIIWPRSPHEDTDFLGNIAEKSKLSRQHFVYLHFYHWCLELSFKSGASTISPIPVCMQTETAFNTEINSFWFGFGPLALTSWLQGPAEAWDKWGYHPTMSWRPKNVKPALSQAPLTWPTLLLLRGAWPRKRRVYKVSAHLWIGWSLYLIHRKAEGLDKMLPFF